jgi:hypothetical protein
VLENLSGEELETAVRMAFELAKNLGFTEEYFSRFRAEIEEHSQ